MTIVLCLALAANIDEFFERFTKEWLRLNPVLASRAQAFDAEEQNRLDRELTPATPKQSSLELALARKGLTELRRFDRKPLSETQRVSAAVLEWQLERVVRGAPFEDHRYVFNQFRGLQSLLVQTLSLMPVRREQDARNVLARMAQVGQRIDEGIAAAREREKRGLLPPREILKLTIDQMRRLIEPEPGNTVWVTTLAQRLDGLKDLPAPARADLLETAKGTVENSIHPAFRRAIAMLESQVEKAPAEVGLWRLPNGAAAYANAVHGSVTVSMPAEKIHQIGLEEVARIEKEIDRVLRQLGETEGPLEQRIGKAQAKEPGTIRENAPGAREKILAEYESMIRDAERRADALFDLRPKAPVAVRREAEYREANSAASYTPPAPDGSRPGIFWVPMPRPPFSASRSLAYHEAVPGHHFQLAIQGENTGLPLFRKRNVFGVLSGHGEGWGLYAERLAWEQGWYQGDLYGELDYLVNSALFRAKRLVVDTGLHTKRWTVDQGVAYGIRRSEVERYAANPGQANAYKLGELKIVELREKAKRELGGRFSLKEFHNVVLRTGSVPLDVLAAVIDGYIDASKR